MKDTQKMLATRIDAGAFKRLKHLTIDLDRTIADLIEEAIRDLLDKYKKPSKD